VNKEGSAAHLPSFRGSSSSGGVESVTQAEGLVVRVVAQKAPWVIRYPERKPGSCECSSDRVKRERALPPATPRLGRVHRLLLRLLASLIRDPKIGVVKSALLQTNGCRPCRDAEVQPNVKARGNDCRSGTSRRSAMGHTAQGSSNVALAGAEGRCDALHRSLHYECMRDANARKRLISEGASKRRDKLRCGIVRNPLERTETGHVELYWCCLRHCKTEGLTVPATEMIGGRTLPVSYGELAGCVAQEHELAIPQCSCRALKFFGLTLVGKRRTPGAGGASTFTQVHWPKPWPHWQRLKQPSAPERGLAG
jgi:hypothetical protein